jgi:hypothetical protein
MTTLSTRFASILAACVVFVAMAGPTVSQAAQIVA